MKLLLANPRGFCAGVDRAIEIVKKVLEEKGSPIYVKHEVVHNKIVVKELENLGAVFVEEISDIPKGETVIYSAHGVSKTVVTDSNTKDLDIFDATCPLVSKVHAEVSKYSSMGLDCILIGHANHPEVEGTMGQFNSSQGGKIHLIENEEDIDKLQIDNSIGVAYVTQTTLSVDDTQIIIEKLKNKFDGIIGPKSEDICYATQSRQDAVKQLALECDLVLVVGSTTSSNSNRLREISERSGVESYLIDGSKDIKLKWFVGKNSIGLTSGASAPEHLVQEVMSFISSHFDLEKDINSEREDEGVYFNLPKKIKAFGTSQ